MEIKITVYKLILVGVLFGVCTKEGRILLFAGGGMVVHVITHLPLTHAASFRILSLFLFFG